MYDEHPRAGRNTQRLSTRRAGRNKYVALVPVQISGRIKALVLRRHSDWFSELRLPQRSSIAAAAIDLFIWICLLRRDVPAIEHAAIDLFIWICLLWRVFYPQCTVNFSNFTINTSCRNIRRGTAIRALLYGPFKYCLGLKCPFRK